MTVRAGRTKRGLPGDITPRADGAHVEASAPEAFRRQRGPGGAEELPAQHAAFLCWAALPEDLRDPLPTVSRLFGRSRKTLALWRTKRQWVARSQEADAAEWCMKLLRALYPSLLSPLAKAIDPSRAPSKAQRKAAYARELETQATTATAATEALPTEESPPTPARDVPSSGEIEARSHAQIIDEGLMLVASSLQKKTAPTPKWSEVPQLVRAARLLKDLPTEIVGGGGVVIRDSARVELAKATGEERALVEALRDDLRETMAALDAILVPIEHENVLPFPQPVTAVEKKSHA